MRWIFAISLVVIIAGAGLLIAAAQWPVYTDPAAPGRIGEALAPDNNMAPTKSGRDERFAQWFSQLRAYETPYKKLSDLGRGLCAAGIGCLLAMGWWRGYQRQPWMRTRTAVLALWILLWLSRIPFSFWFYTNRQERHDYPWWGDSIAIPIFEDAAASIIGAAVTSLLLLFLFWRHPLSGDGCVEKPRTAGGWARAGLLVVWMGILGLVIGSGICVGDEGAVVPCLVAAVILTAFLGAREVRKADGVTKQSSFGGQG